MIIQVYQAALFVFSVTFTKQERNAGQLQQMPRTSEISIRRCVMGTSMGQEPLIGVEAQRSGPGARARPAVESTTRCLGSAER